MKTQALYRPVGLKELKLIAQSGWKYFPPGLEWHQIFYPVLNEAYAARIAAEWNTGDAFSGYLGVVTAFEVDVDLIKRYPVHNGSGAGHDELWVPAAELDEFNRNIQGAISIVQVYFGTGFAQPDDAGVNAVSARWQVK